MKTKWKILLSSILAFIQASAIVVASVAWFDDKASFNLDNSLGYTASSYFKGGTGTSTDPFLIDQPVHLYNLAWLQYVGYFNKSTTSGGTTTYDQTQTYFKIDDNVTNLDMSGVVLPPIGTVNNPFIGIFNGNNKVISNLVVTNAIGTDANSISIKPINVTSANFTGVNIVGMFGVVGDYNGEGKYSSITPVAQDFYLNNCTVNTQLTNTLIGLVAGYANGSISNVGIINSNIQIAANSTAFNSALTSNLSNYATVGYAADAYKSTIVQTVRNVRTPSVTYPTDVTTATGSANKWGGSIDMNSLYKRLRSYQKSTNTSKYYDLDTTTISSQDTITTYPDNTTDTTSTYYTTAGKIRNYYDDTQPLYGRYSFSWDSSSSVSRDTSTDGSETNYDFLLLYGKKSWTKSVVHRTATMANLASIYYGGYYMIPSGTTAVTKTSSSTSASIWAISNYNGTGTISTTINSTTYYLSRSGSTSRTLTLSTTSYSWTIATTGSTIKISNNSYYINYYNSKWQLYPGLDSYADLTYATGGYTYTTTSTDTNVASASTYDTYFPLNVDANGLPNDTNTGYVVAGANYNNGMGNGTSNYYGAGDIRVSRFMMGNLAYSLDATTASYTSWNNCSATFDSTKFEILTQNASGLHRIGDLSGEGGNYGNGETTNVNSNIRGYTKIDYPTLGFQKYKTSRLALAKVLSDTDGTNDVNDPVYGLHFMDASININSLVEIEQASINNVVYNGYQMPRDSIDFNVKEKGYINFFAGSYFTGNNTFFSLHEIKRNTNDITKISSIKEISKIYVDSSNVCVYYYADGTYSNGSTTEAQVTGAGYSLKFDMSWVTSPTIVENCAYYYEIPVNPGEYALGSVSGKNGAYLMYLDISANAQPLDRTAITEYISTVSSSYEYPLGVALVATTTSVVDAKDSIAVKLSTLFNGLLNLSRTNDNVTLTRGVTTASYSPIFIGQKITLYDGNDPNTALTAVPIDNSTHTENIKRLTYIDYNLITEETTTCIMTETSIDGGSATRSFTKVYTIVNASTGHVVGATVEDAFDDLSTITDLSTNTSVLEFNYYHTSGATIRVAINLTTTVDSSVTDKVLRLVTGYNLVPTSSEAITIKVTIKSATYVVTITRGASDVVTVDVNSSVDIVATP